jgi:hypothetical protein
MVCPITGAESYVRETGKSMKAMGLAVTQAVAVAKSPLHSEPRPPGQGAVVGDNACSRQLPPKGAASERFGPAGRWKGRTICVRDLLREVHAT